MPIMLRILAKSVRRGFLTRRRFGICGALISMMSATLYAADYSNGMQAYLNGDYDQAQAHWLKGAEARNAKSMFNLGLLHERGQIAGANKSKAESWFRLAGKNGYAAADYHLALTLIEAGKPISDVKDLLERSSQNGYQPAKQKLSQSVFQGDKSGATRLNDKRIDNSNYQTETWLKRRPSQSWTIQMLAFNDERKVQAFIDDHGLKRQAAYYAEKADEETLYKLVYGVYDSKDKADFARQNLSHELKQHGPWLRTIESVQGAIKTQ